MADLCLPTPPTDTGSGAGTGAGSSGAGSGPLLAFTGADALPWVEGGLILLAIGVGFIFIALMLRRRRDKDRAENGMVPVPRTVRRRFWWATVPLGLVLASTLALGATPSPAQAETQVGVATSCGFLELSNLSVSDPDTEGLVLPNGVNSVAKVTITNEATFDADVYLSTVITSDSKNAASVVTLRAVSGGGSTLYNALLSKTSESAPILLAAGGSITVTFTATMAAAANNLYQAAPLAFTILVSAIQSA